MKEKDNRIHELKVDLLAEQNLNSALFLAIYPLWRSAKALLEQVECDVDEGAVVRELQDFVHELSKSHHRVSGIPGDGIVCGGEQPLECAVALVILLLQKRGVVEFEVRFVNSRLKDTKLLVDGTAVPPYLYAPHTS